MKNEAGVPAIFIVGDDVVGAGVGHRGQRLDGGAAGVVLKA